VSKPQPRREPKAAEDGTPWHLRQDIRLAEIRALPPAEKVERLRVYQKAYHADAANHEKAKKDARNRYADNPDRQREASRRYIEAHPEKVRAGRARSARKYYAANADTIRAQNMVKHPEWFRKAYDPLCRPFPATLDPVTGEWVRVKKTTIPAPDTSPEAHLAAALLIIEERLNYPDDPTPNNTRKPHRASVRQRQLPIRVPRSHPRWARPEVL
jgi:hypothetical protein